MNGASRQPSISDQNFTMSIHPSWVLQVLARADAPGCHGHGLPFGLSTPRLSRPRLLSTPLATAVTRENTALPAGGSSKSSTQFMGSPQCRSASGLEPGTWVYTPVPLSTSKSPSYTFQAE